MDNSLESRNIGIDLLRFIGAYAVIVIHVFNLLQGNNFYSGQHFDWLVMGGTSFAVPMFFIVSGYFYNKKNSEKKRITVVLKFISLYLTVLLVYSIVFFNKLHFLDAKSLFIYLLAPNLVARHLWFLTGMIIGYGIIFCIKNKLLLYIVATAVFIIGLMWAPITYINGALVNLLYPQILSLPLILLGMVISRYENIILNFLPSPIMALMLFLSLLGLIMEAYIQEVRLGTHSQFYFLTYPYVIFIFLSILRIEIHNKIIKRIAKDGMRFSLFIYLYHFLFIDLFGLIVSFDDLFLTLLVNSVIYCGFTLGTAYFLSKISCFYWIWNFLNGKIFDFLSKNRVI